MDRAVDFRSDGLSLSPAEYARLLVQLAEERGIAADEFSREGVVVELEERMAALLGKEMALFLPSGTLANHLALRLLATRGRLVLVQRESHIYNDTGDCAQELSGLTLIPLAPQRATFTLAEIEDEIARLPEARVDPGRRDLDRIPGAPAPGRGLRLHRDAADRRLCAGASDRASPRWCPHLARLGLHGDNPGELRSVVRHRLRLALQILQRRRRRRARRAEGADREPLSSAAHVRRQSSPGLALCGGGLALPRRLRRTLSAGRRCRPRPCFRPCADTPPARFDAPQRRPT